MVQAKLYAKKIETTRNIANFLSCGWFAATLLLTSPVQALEIPFLKGKKNDVKPKAEKIEQILIAVDGLSQNAFFAAQKQGLFQQFKNSSAHIAPFPTMTDISWAKMTKTVEVFGASGRIKSVEATYFDESTESIQGDPRDYYRRLAAPKYYMGAFQHYFNPYVEGLMYFPTEEVPKLEVKTVIDNVLAAKPQKVITAYLGAVDSIAHTQANRLFPILKLIDSELKRLEIALRARGQTPEIILVSDHGNIGRFQEGQPEVELHGIDIAKHFEKNGFNFVQQLKQPKDLAMPLMALGTWGPVYVKDRKNILSIIKTLTAEEWFDLAAYLNKNNAQETQVTVISAKGYATIQYLKHTQKYYYYTQGNPLHIPANYISTSQKKVALSKQDSLSISAATQYPDAIHRLVESASNRDFDFPDIIITLKDGYYIKSSLGAFTKMVRTHGSLTKNSSLGIVASTQRSLPASIRSDEILSAFGIQAQTLFGETYSKNNLPLKEKISSLKQTTKTGVPTQARDFSQKRIFQHLTRFVSDTRPFFVVSEIKSFADAFKFDPLQKQNPTSLTPLNFDISKFDVATMLTPDDIGAITDAVLTSGSIENLSKDARIQNLKGKIESLQGSKQLSLDLRDGGSHEGLIESVRSYLLPSKRAAMKLYQLPYLLEKSITIQEKPILPEARDANFASYWLNYRDRLVLQANFLNKQTKEKSVAAKLFEQIQNENELEEKIYPTSLNKVYNKNLSSLTLVYVPGIYNAIFDKEIFSLGLNSLEDDLGLRVLRPSVFSTCSSEYNGKILKDFLRKDYNQRIARGQSAPKYLFLSYSKGAVDTLHYLLQDGEFVANNVAGVVSIAAPLHGSSILDKTDLPFEIVSALSEQDSPEICKSKQTAAKSITPSNMQSFWRKNERALTGLTRYYSVTFVSEPENSHIFMKATKLIAQFDEDNDGVVTASSSKFPAGLNAVDLGTIKADHLAGILASSFNQKVFLKSLVHTLAELEADNDAKNLNWNITSMIDKANQEAHKTNYYYVLQQKSGRISKMPTNARHGQYVPELSEKITNTYRLNKLIMPKMFDPADSFEPTVKLPSSEIKYDPYTMLDVAKLPNLMANTKVKPTLKQEFPQGINIEFNHKNVVHFRMDHQFNYESRSPLGMDDNPKSGYAATSFMNEKNWLAMRSDRNSIRLTTLAYRFSPVEFARMHLKLAVTKGVAGADPVKGKSGIDDSAFQVWFTIREGRSNNDRSIVDIDNDKVFLFGYYWGDPVSGERRHQGEVFENWYSDKNVVVATLPHAKQLLLNDEDMLGKALDFERNLAADLKKAFPHKNLEDLDIVAITIQHDSNDASDSSEAYFKHLRFLP
ncbi:MAG: hypothetical protein ACLGGX_06470 [Bdellovibrionia bacterium]